MSKKWLFQKNTLIIFAFLHILTTFAPASYQIQVLNGDYAK